MLSDLGMGDLSKMGVDRYAAATGPYDSSRQPTMCMLGTV